MSQGSYHVQESFAERVIHPRFASESKISGKVQGSRRREGQLIGLSPT